MSQSCQPNFIFPILLLTHKYAFVLKRIRLKYDSYFLMIDFQIIVFETG